ncbi:MAG: transcription elongation factor subunit Spt4 [archaeon]|nr:transcription elongation factor subunit Spt4 [archaeon]
MTSIHKACRQCKTIYEGSKCPKCGSEEFSDSSKGKIIILNSEQSEIAKNLKLKEKGTFAIKL